jgi:anti-sigma factor NepR-like protein
MGDERLSAKNGTESDGSAQSRRSRKSDMPEKNARKKRPSDLGRALRSIYDDTLREPIPDDFVNLIGKLR